MRDYLVSRLGTYSVDVGIRKHAVITCNEEESCIIDAAGITVWDVRRKQEAKLELDHLELSNQSTS